MPVNALSLSVQILASSVTLFLIISISEKFLLKKKPTFLTTTSMTIIGTLVYTLFFPLSDGIIASALMLTTLLVLFAHFFDCSYQKAGTATAIAMIAIVIITVLLSIFGLTVSTRWF